MNESSEVQRLGNAVAALSAVTAEIITERLVRLVSAQDRRVAPGALEPLLTKRQVAELLRVSERSINLWMSCGYLPYFKIRENVRFRMSDVQAALVKRFQVGGQS